jgi:membrane protease YdiL (CAAX protease family)
VKYVERRKCHELSINGSFKEFGIGFIISLSLVSIMVLLMVVLGLYKVVDINSAKVIVDGFFFFAMGAFIQVMFFRIIVFRLTEELLGSWLAIILIPVIFGFVHIFNTNATIWTSIGIMITDILWIAVFMYTRRIWMVWGLHMGWNFIQDGIFGMSNSGITEFPSWLDTEITGPQWLTGGNFGIEASYITISMILVVGFIILKKVIQHNQIIKPIWVRQKAQHR